MTESEGTSEKHEPKQKSSSKKARSPVERAIVWGLIAICAVVVVIEFRAKTGYESSLEYIQNRVNAYNSAEVAEDVPALNLSEMKQHLSGGPSLSEVSKSALGERLRTLKWFSLFKKYELTIVVTNDTDEAVVFRVKSGE